MPIFTIRVNPKTGQNYFPKDIRSDGFTGKIQGFSDAMTLVLLKPGAELTDAHASLGIIREDIALRMVSDEKKIEAEDAKRLLRPTARQGKGSKYPIFAKFSRRWISRVTGYSMGYLCRVATGHQALSAAFIARCCHTLRETEEGLFGPQVLSKREKPPG